MAAGAMQALVLGILAWVPYLLGVPGIIAAVFGHLARREIRRNPMLRGRGQAMAGLILGYSAVFLAALWLIGWIIEQRSS